MDVLTISNLSVFTKIGVHEWEQRINQQLLIDISISTDFSACEDQLENTLDYDAICQTVTHFVESTTFKLIETVANRVAELIKKQFQVTQLTVSVNKPHAIKNAGGILVSITR